MTTNSYDPFGFEPTGRGAGGGGGLHLPHRKASGTPSVYRGDILKPDSNGEVLALTTPGTDLIIGVAASHLATGTASDNLPVIVSPDMVYRCKVIGGTPAQTNVFNNMLAKVDASRTVADNESNRSVHGADGTAMATTAAHDLKIAGVERSTQNGFGAGAVLLVTLNKHVMQPAAGIAGV